MNIQQEPIIISDFFTIEQSTRLVRTFTPNIPVTNNPFWNNRLCIPNWTQTDIDKIFETRDIVQNIINEELWICFPHTVIWKENHPGMPLHSDYGEKIEFPFREWSIRIALNDDYEGGATKMMINNKEREFNIDRGDLLIYNGGQIQHGVAPITKGDRYSVIYWFALRSQYPEHPQKGNGHNTVFNS